MFQHLFETLRAGAGLPLAVLVVAVISGVFPLVNSELTLGYIATQVPLSSAIGYALLIACGQSLTHASLFFSARAVTRVGEQHRPKLHAKIEKGRALVARWEGRWGLLVALAAVFGIPPLILVAAAAGALGYRFRRFWVLEFSGRVTRFVAIAIAAYYVF